MAEKKFISDDEMAKLEASSVSSSSPEKKFLSDADMAKMEKSSSISPSADPNNPPTPLSAIVHGFTAGASGQFADEAARAMGDEAAVKRMQASQETYPLTYGAANIGGAIAQGIAAAPLKLGTLAMGAAQGGLHALGLSKKESAAQAVEDTTIGALAGLGLAKVGGQFIDRLGKPIFSSPAESSQAVKGIMAKGAEALGTLGTFAGTGAAANLILQQPETWDQAKRAVQNGALIGMGAGLTGKAAVTALGGVSSAFKAGIMSFRKPKIDIAEEALANAKETASLSKLALRGAEESKISTAAELKALENKTSLLRTGLDQTAGIIDNAEPINLSIGTLTDDVSNTFKNAMTGPDGIGERIAKDVGNLKGEVHLASDIDAALKGIDSFKAFTPGQMASKTAATNLVKSIESATGQAESQIDPFTKQVLQVKQRKLTPADAWEAKKQVQDLLYNKEFLAGSGPQLRGSLVKLERSLRNKITDLDHYGNLKEYNKVYEVASKARDFADENFSTNYFKLAAKNPKDPEVLANAKKFNEMFDEADASVKDPIVKAQLRSLKDGIESRVNSTLEQYATLEKAKALHPKLESEFNRNLTTYERALERFQQADTEIAQKALASKQAKTGIMRKEAALARLHDPDIRLPVIGNVSEYSRQLGSFANEISTARPLKATGESLRRLRGKLRGE